MGKTNLKPKSSEENIMTKQMPFQGPVFVIGMPRSGTKLLRDVLNNHSAIGITAKDSHCLPYFYNRFKEYGNPKVKENFYRFYNDFSSTVFFQRLTSSENFIDRDIWYNAIKQWDYQGIIETFYKLYTTHTGKKIWGDKTPSYLLHMPLLISLFPEAKFIHIIRDARDYCLSLKKGFSKNIYRAAQRWKNSIKKCREDSKNIPSGHYLEIHYENLTDHPERILKEICNYLQIPFEKNMETFKKATEDRGDTKNYVGIMPQNHGKWKKEFSAFQIKKIERICGLLLPDLGYKVENTDKEIDLNQAELTFYKIIDGFNIAFSSIKKKKSIGIFKQASKSSIHRDVWKMESET